MVVELSGSVTVFQFYYENGPNVKDKCKTCCSTRTAVEVINSDLHMLVAAACL
jgi:hypothetical protein